MKKKPAVKKLDDPIIETKLTTRRRVNFANAAALSRVKSNPAPNPFVIPAFPRSAMPEGDVMALDSQIIEVNSWATQSAFGNMFVNGSAFLGYPYLSQLAQIPEYRKLAETTALHMTRKFITLQSSGDSNEGDGDDKAQKIKDITDALDNFKVKDVARRAVEIDSYFGRSHLYVDLGEPINRNELKMSIGNGRDALSRLKVRKGSLKGFKAIEPVWTYPGNYNSNDPTSNDWYNPQTWFVMGKEFHVSRLMKLVGHEVSDLLKPAYSFGGLSLSQMAKPYIDNWLRTRQSVADLVWSFSTSGISTDLSTLMATDGQGLFDRAELFNNVRNNRGVMLLNKDSEEFFQVNTPLGTLDKLQAQAQEHMASVSSIPLIFLLGITPSGLNASSEGEIRAFYDFIHAYQEKFLRDPLTRVIDFIQLHLYGKVDPEITFIFEPLWSMTEKEQSEIDKTSAETDDLRINGGVISPLEARKRVANAPDTPYANLDVTVIPIPPGSSDENGDGEIEPDEESQIGGQGLDPGRPRGGAHGNTEDENPFAQDEFKEGDHPRGQPENKGQFGPGGNNEIHHNAERGVYHVKHKGEFVNGKSGSAKTFMTTEAAKKFADKYTGEQAPAEAPKEKPKYTGPGISSGEGYKKVATIAEYMDIAKKAERNLTDSEKAALHHYTSPAYGPLNKALRGGKDMSPETQSIVDTLDDVIANSELPEPLTLFRGLRGKKVREHLDSLMPGDTLTDKGFVSTSLSAGVSKDQSQGQRSMMIIRAPKGANAAFPGEHSYNKTTAPTGHEYDDALEAVLPRESQFKFIGKKGANYEFELVNNKGAHDEAHFEESKHPRGQPGNAGQFGPGGGGGTTAKKSPLDLAKHVTSIVNKPAGISNSYRNSIKELLQDPGVSEESKIKLKYKMIESYVLKSNQLVKAGDKAKAEAVAMKAAKLAKSMGAASPTPPKSIPITETKPTPAPPPAAPKSKKEEAIKYLSDNMKGDWESLSPEDKDSMIDLNLMGESGLNHFNDAKTSGPVKAGQLSAAKAAHIFAYTDSAYVNTNSQLRNNELDEETWNHVKQLNSALKSLPAYDKPTTRGTTLNEAELKKWQPGKIVGDHGFMSTTKKKTPSFGGNVTMEVKGKSGRDISGMSHHADEQEVLFPAGTKFKIVSRTMGTMKARHHHFVLEEV